MRRSRRISTEDETPFAFAQGDTRLTPMEMLTCNDYSFAFEEPSAASIAGRSLIENNIAGSPGIILMRVPAPKRHDEGIALLPVEFLIADPSRAGAAKKHGIRPDVCDDASGLSRWDETFALGNSSSAESARR